MYDKGNSSSELAQNNTLIFISFENNLQIPFDCKKKSYNLNLTLKTYNLTLPNLLIFGG